MGASSETERYADRLMTVRLQHSRVKFHVEQLWPRLRQLAGGRSRRAWVAVPFLGRGAVAQLPLRRGDVLVTKFDEPTVRQGLVAPQSVVEFIKRGVEVHAVINLHAKVFVCRTA
jgi:hypothetical protein